MTTAVQTPGFEHFAQRVAEITKANDNERAIVDAVAEELRALIAAGVQIPEAMRQPESDHYVMYPVWVAEDGSFSVASAVWNVGQQTPIHDHGTWGVIGIWGGVEREHRFAKPQHEGEVPEFLEERILPAGSVEVCCTTDQDIHRVSAATDEPCIGIHVYGADIGELPRRWYNAETGEVKMFTSTWAQPAAVS